MCRSCKYSFANAQRNQTYFRVERYRDCFDSREMKIPVSQKFNPQLNSNYCNVNVLWSYDFDKLQIFSTQYLFL